MQEKVDSVTTMKMAMINNLQQECIAVKGAIDLLISCRRKLEENAAKAKAQVNAEASTALDALRFREIQLLRQIDVIESHHANVLFVQHAKLNQLLGNLKHALHCARQQHDAPSAVGGVVSDEDMEVVREVNRLRSIQHSSVSFWCDMNRMVKAIQQFGMVESTGHLLDTEQDGVVSRCLPSRFEDYEDGDHQLLYKAIEELKLDVGAVQKGLVTWPKLSANKDDWLRKESRSQPTATCCLNNPAKFVLPDNLRTFDTSQWLKGNQSAMVTSIDGSRTETWLRRQMVQNVKSTQPAIDTTTSTASSVASESIEMISHADTMDSVASNFTWLASPSRLPFRGAAKELLMSCRIGSATAIDIENLGNVTCANKNVNSAAVPFKDRHLWLARGGIDDYRSPGIERVCCANEQCRTFSECVCDVSCDRRNCDSMDANHKSRKSSDLAAWLKSTMSMVDGDGNGSDDDGSRDASGMEKMDVSEKDGHWVSLSSNRLHCSDGGGLVTEVWG